MLLIGDFVMRGAAVLSLKIMLVLGWLVVRITMLGSTVAELAVERLHGSRTVIKGYPLIVWLVRRFV